MDLVFNILINFIIKQIIVIIYGLRNDSQVVELLENLKSDKCITKFDEECIDSPPEIRP